MRLNLHKKLVDEAIFLVIGDQDICQVCVVGELELPVGSAAAGNNYLGLRKPLLEAVDELFSLTLGLTRNRTSVDDAEGWSLKINRKPSLTQPPIKPNALGFIHPAAKYKALKRLFHTTLLYKITVLIGWDSVNT